MFLPSVLLRWEYVNTAVALNVVVCSQTEYDLIMITI